MNVDNLETSKKEIRKIKKKKKLQALIDIAMIDSEAKNDAPVAEIGTENDKEDGEISDNCTPPKKMKCDNLESSITSEDDYKELQSKAKRIRNRNKTSTLTLRTAGHQASLCTHIDDRVPLLITDVQHIILHSVMEDDCPFLPLRWCLLNRCKDLSNTVVVVVDGLSLYEYASNESSLSITEKIEYKLEIVTPASYKGSIVDELAAIPLTDDERNELVESYGSMAVALESRKDLMVMMRAVFPVLKGKRPESTSKTDDRFSRAQLVLSAWQLIEESYPLPLKGKLKQAFSKYVMTKDEYEPVTADSPLYGLDCEMCRTKSGYELTRISLIDEKYETVYESYVLPYNTITDYMTAFSGITRATLADVTTRIEDVQAELRKILPANAILVGQSLNFDLHALKMMHPYIIDTSVIFNTTGIAGRKSKLKQLAKQFLHVEIQQGNKGHCSIEDAVTSLKLVKLKLSKDLTYGDAVLKQRTRINNYDHLKTKSKEYATNIFNKAAPKDKDFLIVGARSVVDDYGRYFNRIKPTDKIKAVYAEDNASVVGHVCEESKYHSLTFSHVNLSSDSIDIKEKFILLNTWLEQIRTNLSRNSLFITVLSGNEECNGVALMDIKK